MSWRQRGEHRYYYRNRSIKGKKTHVYVGCGAVAELAFAADNLRRLSREIEVHGRQQELARIEEAHAPLLQLCVSTDTLSCATLLAAGYHRNDRSAWRRRRESTQPN